MYVPKRYVPKRYYVEVLCNGEIKRELAPEYIVLGHELVHAWRSAYGFSKKAPKGSGSPKGSIVVNGEVREKIPIEELETTGLNYMDADLNQMRNYSSYEGIISENGLRIENGLNIRASYEV